MDDHKVEIAMDVGGTFVDVIVKTPRAWHASKVLITDAVEPTVLRAIDVAMRLMAETPDTFTFLAHATTVATNILLEDTGAKVGLITTRGFRDVLEIGRQNRPSLYDSRIPRPTPLVPRDLRLEVDERIDAHGRVLQRLNLSSVRHAVHLFAQREVEAVAICLLNSWTNPSHELALAEYLGRKLPNVLVFPSSSIAPQHGEYERTSTAVVSAYIGPPLGRYLRQLDAALTDRNVSAPLWLMQSNAGLGTVGEVLQRPTIAQFSGPAAGVLGASLAAIQAESPSFVALDVGGTSTDVTLVIDGAWQVQHERQVRGQPVLGDSVAVHSVGAGGGSVAWIDAGGLLKVGPRSAAAIPGPACYGRGGTEATVTDAHLLLGYMSADRAVARDLRLQPDLAERAVNRLGDRLLMSTEEVASGILDVTTANVVRAVRRVTVEAGHDPSDFALVAYGGGGPLYANLLIEELGMRQALIPFHAGVLSAAGLLSARPRIDLARTYITRMDSSSYEGIRVTLDTLGEEARSRLAAQGHKPNDIRLELQLDLRYVGQSHQLTVSLDGDRESSDASLDDAISKFHATHNRLFGVSDPLEPVQSVVGRAVGTVERGTTMPELRHSSRRPAALTQRNWRMPYGWVKAAVYERTDLPPSASIQGPALIDSDDSTVAILPGYTAQVEKGGLLVIARTT